MDARPREAGMCDVMLENMRLENVRLSQRIEALEAAGKGLAEAIVGGYLANSSVALREALAAADAVAPRSTETELELVGSVETEVGEYPYSNRHSLRVLLGRAVSMIAPSLTQGQSMDEADRMLSSTIAAVRAIEAPAPVSVPEGWKPIAVVQRDQPIPDSEIVRELKQLHLSLMSSADAHYRGDAFARAAICIERLLTTANKRERT